MNAQFKTTLIANLAAQCERMITRMETWKDELANPSTGFEDDLRRIADEYPVHNAACTRIRNLMDDLQESPITDVYDIIVGEMYECVRVAMSFSLANTDRWKMSHKAVYIISVVLNQTLKECEIVPPIQDRQLISFFNGMY